MIVASNPQVKKAWNADDAGHRQGRERRPGRVQHLVEHRASRKATFATVTCPAWMMGYIQGQAPKTAGDWDIAAVPGGGGNWGGSFLAVPKQSKNQELAAELVKFLTSPASEAYVFKQTGNLPSEPALLTTPGDRELQEPVLQQRAGREDLHHLGEGAEAADHRPAPG